MVTMLTLPLQLVQRNREILTETVRMLDEEEREDTELKSRFREKWTRQSSAGLAENLRKEVSLPLTLLCASLLSLHQVTKFQNILETASRADQTVREKYESHKEAIVLLGKPVGELQAALPKAGALSSRVQNSPVGRLPFSV